MQKPHVLDAPPAICERPAAICARLAGRQKGVVSRQQLLAAGVDSDAIRRLLRMGFLHRVHQGVYAVSHLALPKFGREQAALLACGEGAVLSGGSALYVWGILDAGPAEVEVTIGGCHRRERPGIRLRLVDTLDERETRSRHGLDVVFPARALTGFAADATPEELGDAVAEARAANLIRDGELEAAAEVAAGRRGAPQMRAFLRDEGGPAITRSRAERRFRKLLSDAQLPQPKANPSVAGLRVDFLWEAERVVLEVDGYRFHGHRRAFETDRKRDRILSDAGYHVIRVTWRHFTEEPMALIAHIARILDRRNRVPH
jgi:very-short-patch-repair endonuclease